jgi:hypothetical protein
LKICQYNLYQFVILCQQAHIWCQIYISLTNSVCKVNMEDMKQSYDVLPLLHMYLAFWLFSLGVERDWFYFTSVFWLLHSLWPCSYTPLAVVSRARKTLRVWTTATIAQITGVSSKEGAVIGAVLSTRKFHR